MAPVISRPNSPTRWARHECKYVITDAAATAIREWMRPWVEPDPHAARNPLHEYRISSLYLDTSQLRLFQETLDGQAQRNKLRIRSYSRDEKSPVFLEIKRRLNNVVEKVRARVTRETVRRLLDRRAPSPREIGLRGAEADGYSEFVGLVEQLDAHPILHVGYRRQAYMGLFQPDARVTFDRGIVCAPAGELDALDETTVTQAIENQRVVLELKFTGRFPNWIEMLVEHFELQRTSYSKYGESVRRGGIASIGYSSFLSSTRG